MSGAAGNYSGSSKNDLRHVSSVPAAQPTQAPAPLIRADTSHSAHAEAVLARLDRTRRRIRKGFDRLRSVARRSAVSISDNSTKPYDQRQQDETNSIPPQASSPVLLNQRSLFADGTASGRERAVLQSGDDPASAANAVLGRLEECVAWIDAAATDAANAADEFVGGDARRARELAAKAETEAKKLRGEFVAFREEMQRMRNQTTSSPLLLQMQQGRRGGQVDRHNEVLATADHGAEVEMAPDGAAAHLRMKKADEAFLCGMIGSPAEEEQEASEERSAASSNNVPSRGKKSPAPSKRQKQMKPGAKYDSLDEYIEDIRQVVARQEVALLKRRQGDSVALGVLVEVDVVAPPPVPKKGATSTTGDHDIAVDSQQQQSSELLVWIVRERGKIAVLGSGDYRFLYLEEALYLAERGSLMVLRGPPMRGTTSNVASPPDGIHDRVEAKHPQQEQHVFLLEKAALYSLVAERIGLDSYTVYARLRRFGWDLERRSGPWEVTFDRAVLETRIRIVEEQCRRALLQDEGGQNNQEDSQQPCEAQEVRSSVEGASSSSSSASTAKKAARGHGGAGEDAGENDHGVCSVPQIMGAPDPSPASHTLWKVVCVTREKGQEVRKSERDLVCMDAGRALTVEDLVRGFGDVLDGEGSSFRPSAPFVEEAEPGSKRRRLDQQSPVEDQQVGLEKWLKGAPKTVLALSQAGEVSYLELSEFNLEEEGGGRGRSGGENAAVDSD